MSEYSERDCFALDKAGSFYCKHVMAMTAEKLHSKSDIAAELGYRDFVIATLTEQVRAQDKWISDIKPMDGQYVLCCYEDLELYTACIFREETDVFESTESGEDVTVDVTHWMPIPPPPKEAE